MLKYVLLATTVALAPPAFAQDASPDTAPATQQVSPAPGETATPQDSDESPVTADDAPPPAEPVTEGAAAPATNTPPTPATPVEPVEPATPTTDNPAAGTPAAEATPHTPAQHPSPPLPPEPTPATPQAQASPAPATTPEATAQQPATSQDQVAQAVGTEFGAYDKDSNGGLDNAEFQTWMAALRKASEPGFSPDTPEATAWFTQAFSMADADKSASVNQAELTTFLTPKS